MDDVRLEIAAIIILSKLKFPPCPICGTKRTPLWRHDKLGRRLCNACGIKIKRSIRSPHS